MVPLTSALENARAMFGILARDLDGDDDSGRPGLEKVDRYLHGDQDDPYVPRNATDEYRLLAKRSITNIYDIVVPTPVRSLYVEGYRRSSLEEMGESHDATSDAEIATGDPDWEDWQRSQLDERQQPVMEAAWAYGHSFTLTLPDGKGKSRTTGLSPLRTTALFVDPANDIVPEWALTITQYPSGGKKNRVPGRARMWDNRYEYPVTFVSENDNTTVTVGAGKPHGCSENPVTRFAPRRDLDGRTYGAVERFMGMQDRLNQSVFDLLVAQAGGSFKVRWATGMAPPMQMQIVTVTDPDTGDSVQELQPVLDSDGNPIPRRAGAGPGDLLYAEDPDVKFGTLDETPLDGYISSIDMTFRHIAALSQTPPHHLLGQIANLSADALRAAESAQVRLVEQLKHSFGESWERVIRLMAELRGDTEAAEDVSGEVVWRDMEQKALSATADGLAKLKELNVPDQGLWSMIPGITQSQLKAWTEWSASNSSQAGVSKGLDAANEILNASSTTSDQDPSSSTQAVVPAGMNG